MLVRPLNPDLKQKAELELNETPKILEDGIKHLKEWISKQPHLRAKTDDQWLAAFLRGCKHSLERAKEKIDLYYSLRTVSPDLFTFRPNNQRFKMIQTGAALILPKVASPLAPRVIITKPSLYDPNMISPIDFFSFTCCCQQVLYLEDDEFVVNGNIGVIDLEGISISYVKGITLTIMKKLVVFGQDASPLRVKGLHFINAMQAFEKIFNFGKKLLHEKLQNRILLIDYWVKKIDQYEDWFIEDLKFGTDESKRPGKPKTAET